MDKGIILLAAGGTGGHVFPAEALGHELKARGYVIYAGQGDLAVRVFRVANMGHLQLGEFRGFLAALGEVLSR